MADYWLRSLELRARSRTTLAETKLRWRLPPCWVSMAMREKQASWQGTLVECFASQAQCDACEALDTFRPSGLHEPATCLSKNAMDNEEFEELRNMPH